MPGPCLLCTINTFHDIYFTVQRRRVARTRRHITRTTRDSNDTRASRPLPLYISRAKVLWWCAPNQSRSEATQAMRGPRSTERTPRCDPPPSPLVRPPQCEWRAPKPHTQTFPTTLQSTGFPNPHARSVVCAGPVKSSLSSIRGPHALLGRNAALGAIGDSAEEQVAAAAISRDAAHRARGHTRRRWRRRR